MTIFRLLLHGVAVTLMFSSIMSRRFHQSFILQNCPVSFESTHTLIPSSASLDNENTCPSDSYIVSVFPRIRLSLIDPCASLSSPPISFSYSIVVCSIIFVLHSAFVFRPFKELWLSAVSLCSYILVTLFLVITIEPTVEFSVALRKW